MDVFASLGQAMMKAGGKIMTYALFFWKTIAELSREYLLKDPVSGSLPQILIDGAGNLAVALGVSLCLVYFFKGFLHESVDLRYQFTMEGMTKMFLRLAIVIFLVENSFLIAAGITRFTVSMVGNISFSVEEMATASEIADLSGNYRTIRANEVNVESQVFADWVCSELKNKYVNAEIAVCERSGDGGLKILLSDGQSGESILRKTYDRKELEQMKPQFAQYVNEISKKETEDYGYFIGIYSELNAGSKNSLADLATKGSDNADVLPESGVTNGGRENTQTTTATQSSQGSVTSDDWLFAGFICLVAGAVGGISIITSSLLIMKTVISRLFKVVASLLFAPAAFANLAEGADQMDRASGWFSTFFGYCMEAVVIVIALKLSIGLFGRLKVNPLDNSVMETAINGIINLCMPLLAGAASIKAADQIAAKCLGI